MIIDGDSNAETLSYLKELKFPFHFFSKKDKGIYDAMNKGVALSKGEWLYFLGSGDKLYDNAVLKSVFSKSISKKFSLIAGSVIYEGNTKPFIYSKKKFIKNPSWSFLIWLRNGLHHQGTFYRKELFLKNNYNLDYKILSDYWFNIMLFKKNKKCYITKSIISKCNSDGVSKTGSWENYKEEINLKVNHSSFLLFPLFYSLSILKKGLRKIINE